ncbi:MAG: glycosyl hydrolase family 5, partial [Fibrobacter sp.]|nr:glycosyl hydrolase family 5 [Fibrobacter sp.]
SSVGVITDLAGNVLYDGVDVAGLPLLEKNTTVYAITGPAFHLVDETGDYLIYLAEDGGSIGFVKDSNATVIGFFNFETNTVVAPDGVTELTKVENILDLPVLQPGDKFTKEPDPVIVESSSSEFVPGPESSSDIGPTPTSSATPNSSSSKPKSSSSAPKSSSSSGGSSYQIKYVNGGKSGSGYATRYWDCCKPHCAWPEHGGSASTCDAKGNKIGDKSASSMCDGGNAGICRSQFPIIINDTLAFAFAATPGGENNCGKCFDLVFDGGCKYDATSLHKKMKGKHLIVMSNNVGYDVAGGQFDVMIPGGGYGIFNGCSNKMGWGSQGSQYGGLLDECEKETGYNSSKYKSCLTEKCNKSFSSDPEAKEGCLFLATWMNAAGNLTHNYREVECPQELKQRY